MTPSLIMADPMIICNPEIMMGKPVIAGTRIPVELIVEKLGAEETEEELLEAYPRLTRSAIHAALSVVALALKADVVYPTAEAIALSYWSKRSIASS